MAKDKLKGIIHFHSRYSYDSNTSIESILTFAEKANLDFVLLTDHDTTEGAMKLRSMAESVGLKIEVPVCAEYSTEFGDVIGAFLGQDIIFNSYSELIESIKEQGGIVMLPHPFYKHKDIEMLANDSDMIEIFNPYLAEGYNKKAEDLSMRYGKAGFYGSDSHLKQSLFNVIVYVENKGDLKSSLLEGVMHCENIGNVNPYEKSITQIIKSFKRRSPKLLLLSVLKLSKIFFLRLFYR
ncbi:MAG: PHP domain-containing protein [Bacteroidales bacterium]